MTRFSVSRRGLLQAAGIAAPLGLIGPRVFQAISVIKPSTNADRFAGKVVANVIS